jgi:hypothetical protein
MKCRKVLLNAIQYPYWLMFALICYQKQRTAFFLKYRTYHFIAACIIRIQKGFIT